MNRKNISIWIVSIFDISFIENETIENELDIKKNYSTLDSYSFEEIEKDFCLIKERREELKKTKKYFFKWFNKNKFSWKWKLWKWNFWKRN